MKRQITKLVAMDADRWHQITMRMTWVFRTGKPVPPVVLAVFGGKVPTSEEWSAIRKLVNAARKADRATERRYEAAERKRARRVYMRDYMRDYRARGAGA